MNLAETADAITDYLLDDRFKQAVLINGDWGTGKTYFANEILTTKIQNKGYDIHYMEQILASKSRMI